MRKERRRKKGGVALDHSANHDKKEAVMKQFGFNQEESPCEGTQGATLIVESYLLAVRSVRGLTPDDE